MDIFKRMYFAYCVKEKYNPFQKVSIFHNKFEMLQIAVNGVFREPLSPFYVKLFKTDVIVVGYKIF